MERNEHKPKERLLCYYGDDFTGSTDVLEALSAAGLRTVLFLSPPTPELLNERFAHVDCFGVAGVGRSLSPEQMEAELRPLFATLRTAGAKAFHYKVCSTFDSAPHVGSIGKAIDIGRSVFGAGRYVPLLVGVPYLGRYTLFGNHFAAAGAAVHRLDRHPTMSRHPVTPMGEADLRLHLRCQTDAKVSLFDILALDGVPEEVRDRLERLLAAESPAVVLFDVLDEQRLEAAGRLIWEEAERADSLFVVGSSGVEYALTAHWKAAGIVKESAGAQAAAPGPVEQLLVVSGSCSPVTDAQIEWALSRGFAGIRVPVQELIRPDRGEQVLKELFSDSVQTLRSGWSLILYTASGPEDRTIEKVRGELASMGLQAQDTGRLIGRQLGLLTRQLLAATGLKRVLVAGGDTSGYVTRELGIYALECLAAIAPGGPLCRAYAADSRFDGLQILLKGGQVGREDFFRRTLQGEGAK